MACRKVNSSLLTKMLRQIGAVLILLSVTAECLECYWCGPLAEQVHRSQRAPSCKENPTNITCEPGYTHCAVVASSPPFVESRYCVKFYQDECYTLYCGTTKTYRTTCPCRGELCNGPNTQREVDAFAALANTVAKTNNNRIKKRNANGFINVHKHKASNLIDPQDEAANLIDNEPKNETTDDSMQTNQTHSDTANTNSSSIVSESNDKDSIPSESHSETSASEIHDAETHDTETNASETQDSVPVPHEEPTETTKAETSAEPNKEIQNNNEIETAPEVPEVNHEGTTHLTEATMKPTETMKSEENVNGEVKHSLELPTAEALQQSESSDTTEKSMEQTITVTDATTHMTTMEDKNMSPKPTKSSKNNSVLFSFSKFVFVICLLTPFTL